MRYLLTDPEIRRYPDHVQDVLKALPMTREEMEVFGDNLGWCHQYGRLLRRAERAGVLPDPTPDLADITPLLTALHEYLGGNPHRIKILVNKHLPAILATAKAKEAEAQAETHEQETTPVVS